MPDVRPRTSAPCATQSSFRSSAATSTTTRTVPALPTSPGLPSQCLACPCHFSLYSSARRLFPRHYSLSSGCPVSSFSRSSNSLPNATTSLPRLSYAAPDSSAYGASSCLCKISARSRLSLAAARIPAHYFSASLSVRSQSRASQARTPPQKPSWASGTPPPASTSPMPTTEIRNAGRGLTPACSGLATLAADARR